ncbi:hypothetical protein FKR81_16545 [Lentzea tibetensis]|uniref:Carboxypeptidase regulatory-like domain-containing protein n=1 Tax=Lentzea tibetensis TaxID=2591470 RepID=A0A563EU86_9PSEU|nr:hypothetical protein [Lentzea tibetensis]TWP51223.1 hypothetical protein FKR81_16545 [Lentzea tibetensis]
MRALLAGVVALTLTTPAAVAASAAELEVVPHSHRIGAPRTAVNATATLTTHVIDRNGEPNGDATGHATNVSTGDGDFLTFDETGTATTALEPGVYDVGVLSITEGPDGVREFTAAANLRVQVTASGGETTVDARPAKPVTAKVDRLGATVVDSSVTIATKVGETGFANSYFTGPGARVYAVPSPKGRQVFAYRPTLGGPGFRYHLVHVSDGRLPDRPVYYTPDARLARLDTTYYGQGDGLEGNNGKPAAIPGLSFYRFVDLAAPSSRVEYYTADPSVTWFNLRVLGSDVAITNEPLRPGASRSTWFRPPVGVALGNGVTRTGDQLAVDVQPFAPSDGKRYTTAFGSGGPGKTTLSLAGKEIGAEETVGRGTFTLAGPGRYALRTSGEHNGTTVASEWSFEPKSDGPVPISVVRTGIGRDAAGAWAQNPLGQVRAGSNHELTLAADAQPGAARTGVPSLEVSYDDGKRWRRLVVGWNGQRGNAWLSEPRTPGFVSLRVSATNADGAKFTQTVLRAYELVNG